MKSMNWIGLALEAAEILIRWGLEKIYSRDRK